MYRGFILLILVLIATISCRKFVWDNPNDTINPTSEPASLKDGLVAYYPFNGNTNDESGNGNNGDVIGAILTSDRQGKQNSAYSFDGETSIFQAQLVFNSYTISLWYNTPRLNNDFSTLYSYNNTYAQLTKSSGIYARFQYPVSPSLSVLTNYTTSLNDWHNLIVSYNSTDKTMNMYIDGTINQFNSVKVTDGLFNTTWENNVLYLGGFFLNKTYYFDGKIDDVRVYNRTLTQSEITYLANN